MKPLRPGDIYPGDVLRDQFGMNAESRRQIVFNPEDVPEHLLHLQPHVERWAISCDVTRGDYFSKQTEAEISNFFHAVRPCVDAINEWLASQPTDVREWKDSTHQFVCLLKAYWDAYQPTDDEIQVSLARQAAERHARELKLACGAAAEHFRDKNYKAVVELLTSFA